MSASVHQAFILDKTIKKTKRKPKSCAQSIIRKYHDLKKFKLKYGQFSRLHELWKCYYKQAAGSFSDDRLLKADYHGCCVHVSAATNSTQIGIRGIVVLESKNTLLLITPTDRLLSIPKQGSIFHFILAGRLYTIYGDNFCFGSAARATKKFKANRLISKSHEEDYYFP